MPSQALLNTRHESDFHDALTHELAYQALLSPTLDVQEGVDSLLDKRPPNYVGDGARERGCHDVRDAARVTASSDDDHRLAPR